MLPRLDALDGRQGPGRRQGPNARQLGDGVGSGVPLGRVARAAPNGLEETRTGPWGAEDDLAAFPQGEDRPTRLDKIKNLHSTDSIDTENSGTRGRSIWVHSRLLDSSVPAGEGGAVGNGVARSLGTEPG